MIPSWHGNDALCCRKTDITLSAYPLCKYKRWWSSLSWKIKRVLGLSGESKMCLSSYILRRQYKQSKVREIFRKILWHSQNIWTLNLPKNLLLREWTYVKFISNWRWISKLWSKLGCLFTFCYSAWANQIKTKLCTDLWLANGSVHKLQICKSVLIEYAPSK